MKLYETVNTLIYRERVKRSADMLEKVGAGAPLWGLFKEANMGIPIGSAFLFASLALTKKEQK